MLNTYSSEHARVAATTRTLISNQRFFYVVFLKTIIAAIVSSWIGVVFQSGTVLRRFRCAGWNKGIGQDRHSSGS